MLSAWRVSVAFALQLEVGREGAQAIHLVAHFAGRSLRRLAQSLVLRLHPLNEQVELGIERVARRRQLLLGLNRHGARGEALRQRAGALLGKDLLERELVRLEQFAQSRAQ